MTFQVFANAAGTNADIDTFVVGNGEEWRFLAYVGRFGHVELWRNLIYYFTLIATSYKQIELLLRIYVLVFGFLNEIAAARIERNRYFDARGVLVNTI